MAKRALGAYYQSVSYSTTEIPQVRRARAAKKRSAATAATATTAEYGLHISEDIEKRMRRCRAPVRAAIRAQLREIAVSAGSSRARAKVPARKQPPLRFYVYEGYRIAYNLDAVSRRLVVLDLELLPVD